MRIVSGKFRGTKLQSPEDRNTRPTADRVRENLFNMLTHGQYRDLIKGAHVADIFAGTGAVGLEALSRGAAHAHFVESHRPALNALKANIGKCRTETATSIVTGDATRLPSAAKPCALVFLDPPYRQDLVEPTLNAVLDKGWLAKDGLIVVQSHPDDAYTIPDRLAVVDERKYGAARLVFLEQAR